jgi:hyperosmotically inducible protein
MLRSRVGVWVGAAAVAMMVVACSKSDPGITTAVKAKMAADDTVKSYRIDVDTKDRVVTLSGAVDTPAAHTRAVELAKNTEGVLDVVDRLTVTPGVTPTTGIDDPLQQKAAEVSREAAAKADEAKKSAGGTLDKMGDATGDAALTAKVKTKFLADTSISGLKIDVDTTNNIVTLTGTVPTMAEKRQAVKVAKETDGVKSVVDRLKVGKE